MKSLQKFVSGVMAAALSLGFQTPGVSAQEVQWIKPAEGAISGPPIMRDQFTLSGAPKQARVRVAGLGHFRLWVNGKPADETLINQAWSEYDARIYTQEFEIGGALHTGENVLAVELGDSFWRVGAVNDDGRYSKTDAMPDFSEGQPYLLRLEGEVELGEGTERVRVVSDASWKVSEGGLRFSHIYGGEDYDRRREPKGWKEAGFDDSGWSSAVIAHAPKGTLTPAIGPAMRAFEVFEPVKIIKAGEDAWTYVFEQNCSALLRYRVRGKGGEKVRFLPCEYMNAETGKVKFTYTWGTGKDIWEEYTLRGDAEGEAHQTVFCYYGCQYVEVRGAVPAGEENGTGLPVIEALELVHVRADNRVCGRFESSSELLNSALRMIDWSIKSNMAHVATDCPHREKNGWQEQNWHMARSISYLYDDREWLRKIAQDIRDTQLPDGHVPTNCPNYLMGIGPHEFWNEAPEWGIAAVLLPWHQYEWYGDTEALEDAYESMKRYVDYLSSTAKEGVITSNLGDWYDYGHGKGDGPSQWTPNEVSATAIWALGAQSVAQAARVLGREGDRERYQSLTDEIRSTFITKFWDKDAKQTRNNGSCQAGNAVALCADLIPTEDRAGAVEAIVKDLEARKWQQTTGEVLQVFLIRALAENGRGDVLHKVYERRERGSYGYMVDAGQTTLPESWDAKPGTGNSMNHFMLGHLVEWEFAYVAGIRQQPGSVGWRNVRIEPMPGRLERARATFEGPTGVITSDWETAGGVFTLRVKIPAGVRSALAVLPDGTRQALRPGSEEVLRCPMP